MNRCPFFSVFPFSLSVVSLFSSDARLSVYTDQHQTVSDKFMMEPNTKRNGQVAQKKNKGLRFFLYLLDMYHKLGLYCKHSKVR
jgi:hypothetical protein